MTRSQLAIIIAASLIVLFFILIFTGIIPGLKPKTVPVPPPSVTQLNMWGFKADAAGWQKLIASYKQSHPNINISYMAVDESNYETNLIDNLAAGTGPDIFLLQNSWIPKFRNKISPASGNAITIAQVNNLFPPIVGNDFVSSGKIWGLPVSIDTLALVYNRDIFDSKQLVTPPATWNDVKNLVPRIRELNSGAISRPAIALGGSKKSIADATDIFSVMMFQLKNQIIDLTLHKATIANSTGVQALDLYTQFSNPRSSVYTWDDSMNSINSFIDGKTAMILAYKREVNEINLKNPVLNLLIAPLPQFDISNPVNIGTYWGLVAASQGRNQNIAWDFINYAATNSEVQKNYVNVSGLPPALRELIPDFATDPSIKVFASQILTAKSAPYIGYPPVVDALNIMIESTLINHSAFETNLKAAEDKINIIIQ